MDREYYVEYPWRLYPRGNQQRIYRVSKRPGILEYVETRSRRVFEVDVDSLLIYANGRTHENWRDNK